MQMEGEKLDNGSERKKGEGYQMYERKIKYLVFYLMRNRLNRVPSLIIVRNKFF